jgi:hypothetical protein
MKSSSVLAMVDMAALPGLEPSTVGRLLRRSPRPAAVPRHRGGAPHRRTGMGDVR